MPPASAIARLATSSPARSSSAAAADSWLPSSLFSCVTSCAISRRPAGCCWGVIVVMHAERMLPKTCPEWTATTPRRRTRQSRTTASPLMTTLTTLRLRVFCVLPVLSNQVLTARRAQRILARADIARRQRPVEPRPIFSRRRGDGAGRVSNLCAMRNCARAWRPSLENFD